MLQHCHSSRGIFILEMLSVVFLFFISFYFYFLFLVYLCYRFGTQVLRRSSKHCLLRLLGVVWWCDGAEENFQCRDVLLIWIIVGQGPIALAVGAVGGCLEIFSLVYFSLSGRGILSVLGRPINLDNGRARAYCACRRCG